MWNELRKEFARLEGEGRELTFWLRDDDAIGPSAALDRLIAVSHSHGVPLALAVIPRDARPELAARLAEEPLVTPVVHGWAHENHAPPGEKKQEFGAHRQQEIMMRELKAALERMTILFAGRALPVFVPPWNRIDPALLRRLSGLGYQAASLFGRTEERAALPVVNTHVDPIDWHGGRSCREENAVLLDLIRLLRSGSPPAATGILLHHLVHDEAAWSFLGRLFDEMSRSRCCRWSALAALIEAGS
jgi:peptidoglycan/xylan/chitin deacetylase (PgdA/CDA1 family)